MKIREIKKRLTGLSLALILVLSGIKPVAAVEADASDVAAEAYAEAQIEEEVQSSESPSQEEVTAAPDEEKAEDEAVMEDASAGSSSSETTVSEAEETDSEEVEEEVTEAVTEEEEPALAGEGTEPKLKYVDKDGTETVLTIQAKNVTKANSRQHYTVAVWSTENGQDDLKWYDMTYNATDQCYEAVVSIKDHKSIGTFNAHLYFAETGKPLTFVLKDTFEIQPVTASNLTVTDVNNDAGTATVTISGVTAPAGVSRVEFPIWCKSDQSDLVWYQGTKVSEGTYQVTLDVSKHSYHYGTYQIHTYGTNGNGVRNFMLRTTCTMKQGEINVEAVEGSDGYTLKASNLNLSNAQQVEFAVWSTANGQDDLKWLVMKPTTSGAVSTKWAPQEFGEYNIHCYIKTKSGQMVFQKGITVEVKGPKVSDMKITTNQKTGKFTIRLSGVEGVQQIKKIQIPVWSDPKQADMIWYEAARQSDGTYLVSGDIAKHNYNLGTYNAHVYIRDEKDKPYFQLKDTFTMEASCQGVKAEDVSPSGAAFSEYLATVENLVVPGGASKVEFAVWSEDNGQDDLKWYPATASGNNYTYTIKTAEHKTAGKYFVHCYVNTKTGKKVFMGSAEFSVDLSAKGTIRLIEKDEAKGTFTVGIQMTESSGSISSVKVPVWVKSDKSDLHEYTATLNESGEYVVTVDAANHKYDFGTYNIQANAEFGNGFTLTAATSTVTFKPASFISVTKTEDGKRKVTVSNVASTVQKVTFPTWSIDKGQDDLVWYNATKESTGVWSAEILGYNLKSAGEVITHCYVDDVFVGAVTSDFTEKELESRIGTQKVHQYAQALIKANGGDLYKVYKWVVNSYTYVQKPIPVPYPDGYTRQEFYFTDAYETKLTNCFGFAATFYWVAKEMGYDVTLKEASVRYRSGAYGPHGWVELVKDGTTYICDPELEYEKGINCYMKTYANSTFSYKPDRPAY